VFRSLQVPPLVTDRRVQIGIYMYVCICIEERLAQFCAQVVSVSEVIHFHKPMLTRAFLASSARGTLQPCTLFSEYAVTYFLFLDSFHFRICLP